MRNISTAVRGHYDNDRYIWVIIIRRFCDKNDVWSPIFAKRVVWCPIITIFWSPSRSASPGPKPYVLSHQVCATARRAVAWLAQAREREGGSRRGSQRQIPPPSQRCRRSRWAHLVQSNERNETVFFSFFEGRRNETGWVISNSKLLVSLHCMWVCEKFLEKCHIGCFVRC
jgi:hypothetical protein